MVGSSRNLPPQPPQGPQRRGPMPLGAAQRGLPISSGVVEAACKSVARLTGDMTEGASPSRRRNNRSTSLREPCAVTREGQAKRRQRCVRAELLSVAKLHVWSAEALFAAEGNTGRDVNGEPRAGLHGVEELRHVRTSHTGTWEVFGSSRRVVAGTAEERREAGPEMNGPKESDSYGFRPGRGAHDTLDALAYAIERRKVNWILDADILRLLRHRYRGTGITAGSLRG